MNNYYKVRNIPLHCYKTTDRAKISVTQWKCLEIQFYVKILVKREPICAYRDELILLIILGPTTLDPDELTTTGKNFCLKINLTKY